MENTHLDPNRPSRPSSEPQVHLRSLGGYRLLRPLGEGGMGLVFLGYSEAEDRQVAIKILGDHLASNQSFVDRFYREANSGSLLNHPNIVRSLNVGRDEASGKHYLVLEYVDGVSAGPYWIGTNGSRWAMESTSPWTSLGPWNTPTRGTLSIGTSSRTTS